MSTTIHPVGQEGPSMTEREPGMTIEVRIKIADDDDRHLEEIQWLAGRQERYTPQELADMSFDELCEVRDQLAAPTGEPQEPIEPPMAECGGFDDSLRLPSGF